MKKSKAILLLLRLPFLTVTVGAVLLGTAFAWWQTGRFGLGFFLLAFAGACFLHIACNVANDYFDFKSGNDAANLNALVPFSGGSRMVLDGFVKPGEALAVSIVFACLGSAIGLYLNAVLNGNVILFIGLGALFFVFSYNGVPIRLVNRGVGELAIFLAWGPLMVIGAYYVQAESFSSFWPLIAAIPSGVLTTLVLLINEFADREADLSTGRKTWVILFGFKKSFLVYLSLALSCYVLVLIGVLFGGWPLWSFLVLITLPLPFMAFKTGMKNLENWSGFLPAVKATILMNLAFLIILSISFVI
ncbi:MAG: prenyltransferase [Candidatus Aminicenantes bacterium]|nr:MAG: prenyltransferase [Candidatus Aminicenantes bacterium]